MPGHVASPGVRGGFHGSDAQRAHVEAMRGSVESGLSRVGCSPGFIGVLIFSHLNLQEKPFEIPDVWTHKKSVWKKLFWMYLEQC